MVVEGNQAPFGLSFETYGLLLMGLSAIFFSMMGTLVKLSSQYSFPSTELVFYRAVFQGVFVVIYMMRNRAEEKEDGVEPRRLIEIPLGTRDQILVVLGRGFMGGLNFIVKFYSILALPLGDAITLFSLHPIITVLMANIFLGEKIRRTHMFSAVASFTGAVLMAGPSFLFADREMEDEVEGVNKLGYLTAILGSFFAASVLVLIRKAGKMGVHTSQLLFSFSLCGGGIALLVGMTLGLRVEGGWIAPPSTKAAWLAIALCGVGAIGQLLLNYAGRFAPAGLGSIARSSDIVWGYILEVLVFGQIPSWTTFGGVTLILVALITVSYEKYIDEQMNATNKSIAKKVPKEQMMGYIEMEEKLSYEKGVEV